jgi:arsenate reductase
MMKNKLPGVVAIAALLVCWAVPLAGCQRASQAASEPQTIVFACPYGSAKSVVAARFFNRMATERGLPYRAVARGITPESTIPSYVREPIRTDGFEIGVDEKPVALTDLEIRGAAAVVCIKCQLSEAQSSMTRQSLAWTDVPDVDAGYAAARDKIVAHLNEFVSRLPTKPGS